jgi:hypothetical protein
MHAHKKVRARGSDHAMRVPSKVHLAAKRQGGAGALQQVDAPALDAIGFNRAACVTCDALYSSAEAT